MYAIDTARPAFRRSRASAACLTWDMITILQSHKYHVKKCKHAEPAYLRDRQIGQLLLKVRMAVPVERILGRRAEAADSPHNMTIGQDMWEATLVPKTAITITLSQGRA